MLSFLKKLTLLAFCRFLFFLYGISEEGEISGSIDDYLGSFRGGGT